MGLFKVEARDLQHLEGDCVGFNPGNRASGDVLALLIETRRKHMPFVELCLA